jgi:hypothetical protein
MLKPSNHQWYPPHFENDDYVKLVNEKSRRGKKNQGSMTTGGAQIVLAFIQKNLI